ncbi:MAG: hypothetical protein WHS46_05505 [Desulfosoma sp.]
MDEAVFRCFDQETFYDLPNIMLKVPKYADSVIDDLKKNRAGN